MCLKKEDFYEAVKKVRDPFVVKDGGVDTGVEEETRLHRGFERRFGDLLDSYRQKIEERKEQLSPEMKQLLGQRVQATILSSRCGEIYGQGQSSYPFW